MLLNSKLPTDILGRVWDLSDIDSDGYLDREEFAVVSLSVTPHHHRLALIEPLTIEAVFVC